MSSCGCAGLYGFGGLGAWTDGGAQHNDYVAGLAGHYLNMVLQAYNGLLAAYPANFQTTRSELRLDREECSAYATICRRSANQALVVFFRDMQRALNYGYGVGLIDALGHPSAVVSRHFHLVAGALAVPPTQLPIDPLSARIFQSNGSAIADVVPGLPLGGRSQRSVATPVAPPANGPAIMRSEGQSTIVTSNQVQRLLQQRNAIHAIVLQALTVATRQGQAADAAAATRRAAERAASEVAFVNADAAFRTSLDTINGALTTFLAARTAYITTRRALQTHNPQYPLDDRLIARDRTVRDMLQAASRP